MYKGIMVACVKAIPLMYLTKYFIYKAFYIKRIDNRVISHCASN